MGIDTRTKNPKVPKLAIPSPYLRWLYQSMALMSGRPTSLPPKTTRVIDINVT